jgi:hypothetical protein
MSMVSHGYGVAAQVSPFLVFSNVAWGHFVRALPVIFGIPGYSMATIGVVVLSATAIMHFLLRMGMDHLIALLLLALILMRPLLFPQFTVNAGLLTCAAVLGSLAYAKNGSNFDLAASGVLAFLGYLIRDQEFALVLCVALPCLPVNLLIRQRKVQIAFLLLLCAMLGAFWYNQWWSSGPDWDYFWALNRARVPFTDFDAVPRLLAQPDVMSRFGLSRNDVQLLGNWFFVDREIANPERLVAVLAELAPAPSTMRFSSALSAIHSIADPKLLPLFLAAVALAALAFSSRILGAWLLCLTSLVVMGLLGRPGAIRVYIPLLTLLLLLSALRSLVSRPKTIAAAIALAAAAFANTYHLIGEARASDQMMAEAQTGRFISMDAIAMWGASFPFEYYFPVLDRDPNARSSKMFGLGVFTFLPRSVSRSEEDNDNGLIKRLRSIKGLLITADEQSLKLLGIYCAEHLHAQFEKTVVYQSSLWAVYDAKCTAGLPSSAEQ